jgi:pimeloyl-ACP methyl ester carboxylesterase
MATYADWLARGERIPMQLPAFAHRDPLSVFTIDTGIKTGPHLTLLHGFPTSSYDFAPMTALLEATHHLLTFDFVGFGDSDKPRLARYSISAQADLVEAMWRYHQVDRTVVVAHDYGCAVAQELLARRTGDNAKGIAGVTFMNGGLYPDLHRALPIQKALATPLLGLLTTWLASERTFEKSLRKIFSPEHQLSADALHEHWTIVTRRNGHRIYDKLIHYIADRRANADRWRTALESNAIPKQFLWGMLDPISGAHVTERLKQNIRPLRLVEMHDIGHYPPLEAPKRVAELIAEWFPSR